MIPQSSERVAPDSSVILNWRMFIVELEYWIAVRLWMSRVWALFWTLAMARVESGSIRDVMARSFIVDDAVYEADG